MSDFRRMPRSALVGPPAAAAARIPPHWLTGKAPGRRDALDHVPLAQFVLLSMLLHALAIALFGAPSGGSREGRAMWGSLQVLLLPGTAPREELPAPTLLPRLVAPKLRPIRPPVAPPPPAAPKAAPEKSVTPAETLPVEAAPTLEPLAFPPLLDRIDTPERPVDVPLQVPLPVEAPVAIPRPIERVEARDRPIDAPLQVPAPVEAPIAIPLPMERVEAPERALEMPPAVELPPLPVLAPSPAPAPPVEAAPLPVQTTPPVARPPVAVPPIPVPTPTEVAPARIEPPPAPAEKLQPAESTVVPVTPPAYERLEPPAPIREVPVKRDNELPAATDVLPGSDIVPKVAAPLPGPSESPFRSSRPRAPSADKDYYDPTAPSIDLEAVRKRAGAIAREGSGQRAILPFPMPPKPEHKTREQIAIENARKPDCRSAYASLGLAAIIPLIANEFGEGSCRW